MSTGTTAPAASARYSQKIRGGRTAAAASPFGVMRKSTKRPVIRSHRHQTPQSTQGHCSTQRPLDSTFASRGRNS